MPWIKAHCADCVNILDKDYRHVHEFLDQYAKIFDVIMFNEYHRSFLHNKYGLEAIRAKWGNEAYIAGVIHISRDYHELRMDNKDMKWIMKHFGKALKYFHNMDNFDPQIDPRVVQGWGGKSLCWIAFENNGLDQYYRSLGDL
jgi:hypothetical protein